VLHLVEQRPRLGPFHGLEGFGQAVARAQVERRRNQRVIQSQPVRLKADPQPLGL